MLKESIVVPALPAGRETVGDLHAIPLCYHCATNGSLVVASYACLSYWTDEHRWLRRFFCSQHSPLTEAQDRAS
jgi:hypothetical protein